MVIILSFTRRGLPFPEQLLQTAPLTGMKLLISWFLGSAEQSVEGMKVICNGLVQATDDPEGSAIDDIVKDSDRLVLCPNKVAKTFDFSLAGASSRSCKYVLNTLMQTFQTKRLADAVKESTLDSLVTELLLWLLDERVPRMDDGSQLLKALNVLMLKILDNAERTSSFVVVINLLRPLDPSRWPSPESNESLAARNQKFSDLVVKCLIKLTKVLHLFLSIDNTPLSITTSRKVILLISRIEMGLSGAVIAEAYLPSILYGTIGIFHNRFTYLWDPASDWATCSPNEQVC